MKADTERCDLTLVDSEETSFHTVLKHSPTVNSEVPLSALNLFKFTNEKVITDAGLYDENICMFKMQSFTFLCKPPLA